MKAKPGFRVCDTNQLKEGDYISVDVHYANEPSSVVLFRHQGEVYAYKNQCVHMPRKLDCEEKTIFDDSGKHLRCSMHGIMYDPVTGESISTICNGEKLTPVKLTAKDEGIWIVDKRVKPKNENQIT